MSEKQHNNLIRFANKTTYDINKSDTQQAMIHQINQTQGNRGSERLTLIDKMDPNQMVKNLRQMEMDENGIKINFNEFTKKDNNDGFLKEEGEIYQNEEFLNELYRDLQMKHPFREVDSQIKKIPICTGAGCFCCCNCCQTSKLESLGIGMVIYFKLMKALIVAFLFIVIANVPIYFIYFSNHKEKAIKSYMDALYKTTIGNIGSTLYNCQDYPLIGTLSNSAMEFEFDCNSMKVTAVMSAGTAKNSQEEQFNIQNCFPFMSGYEVKADSQCDLTKDLDAIVKDSCSDQNTCKVKLDMTQYYSKCKPVVDTTKFYLTYSCYEANVNIDIINIILPRSLFGYIVAGVDLFVLITLMMTFCCINVYQKRDYQKFIETNTYIRDYTLYLNNLKVPYKDMNNELGSLIRHFKMILNNQYPRSIGVGDFQEQNCLNFFNDYKKKVNEYYNNGDFYLYEILYPKITGDKLSSIKKSNNIEKKIRKIQIEKIALSDEEGKNENKIIKKSKEIENLYGKMETIRKEIIEDSQVEIVKDFYMTFRNYRIAKYLEEKYDISKCSRCCMIAFCQKKKIAQYYYKGKWLNLSFAKDEPTNLKWENMTYSSCKRCLRKTMSVLIAVIIMLITLALILICKYFEAQMASDFNTNIDCSYFTKTTIDQVKVEMEDDSKTNKEKILSYCFCSNKMGMMDIFTNTLQEYTIPGTTLQPCKEFVSSYIQYTSLNIGLICAIPLVNTIVIMIFRCLTSFEKNKTVSKDMTSNMWKIFVIRFVNTGILLVIVNIQIEAVTKAIPNFPFFAGSFKDFDPGWYSKVGVVILFSMILDIITPHAASLCEVLLNYIFRCCDSGCSCGRTTKKLTKEDYFSMYTGPVFEIDARFASLLSSFFVTMIFSPGIPLLYVCFFLYLILTYLFDKLLVLRFYRNPPKYDLGIIKNFVFFSCIALILHFGFAIWIYGNPYLLVDKSPNMLVGIKNLVDELVRSESGFGNNILARITLGHNLILSIAFAGIIAIILLIFLFGCLRVIFCNKKESLNKNMSIEIGLAVTMKDLYRNFIIKEMEFLYLKRLKSNPQIEELKTNILQGIKYDRAFITYKIEYMLGHNPLPRLRNNFDEEILRYRKKVFEKEAKKILAGDVSYNIAFLPEFAQAAYFDYTKNLQHY